MVSDVTVDFTYLSSGGPQLLAPNIQKTDLPVVTDLMQTSSVGGMYDSLILCTYISIYSPTTSLRLQWGFTRRFDITMGHLTAMLPHYGEFDKKKI